MFADLFKRLTAPDPSRLDDADARLALGALLVRIAKSDHVYDVREIALIDSILARRYHLNVVEAAQLRANCEAIEHDAPDTVRFTRAIKDAVVYEDREAVIESFWEVVLADGERRPDEDTLLRMVAPMLGVSDQASNMARRRVEAAREA